MTVGADVYPLPGLVIVTETTAQFSMVAVHVAVVPEVGAENVTVGAAV